MDSKDATVAIARRQNELRDRLPFADRRDFDAVERGFLGTITPGVITDADGHVVWDADAYDFIQGDAPDTVNPSLWRQSTLVAKHGLYEVVYQVRGFDLSNVSFIEGDTGVIVIDPLISKETAAAALALYRKHRGDRPVTGLIFTHSHLDHFGGVSGILTHEELAASGIPVVAPAEFVGEAIAENVYAGTAMARRAGYMYGAALARAPKGEVGAGLGQTTSTGHPGIAVPTLDIATTGETHTIDGVDIEFQMAAGTEAPAEMHFHFRSTGRCAWPKTSPAPSTICSPSAARRARPHVWAGYLTEAIERFADRSDVVFTSHHWPTWGGVEIREFLGLQRDLYAYLHDQTLRMLNQGMTGAEIAEDFAMPPALENAWHTHGYYGSVSHNVKAIYQRYMGWFDGNRARLWPHPPKPLAERYVAAMGRIDRVVELAQTAFDDGDFRWAATLLDHAVITEAGHAAARALYAGTLEQLAYGSENGTWRNFYLSGETELREGNFGTPTKTAAPDLVAQLSIEQLLDSIAISVDGPKAWDLDLAFDLTLTDSGRNFRVTLRNGVLVYVEKPAQPASAQATLTVAKPRLLALLGGDTTSAGLDITGDAAVLSTLMGVLQNGDDAFEIIVP